MSWHLAGESQSETITSAAAGSCQIFLSHRNEKKIVLEIYNILALMKYLQYSGKLNEVHCKIIFEQSLNYLVYFSTGGSVGMESACNSGDFIGSLDQEAPLEKETATHSSILARKIP